MPQQSRFGRPLIAVWHGTTLADHRGSKSEWTVTMMPDAPISVSNAVTYQGPKAPVATGDGSDLTFGEVMHDMNPLQYLPVVGTIYRAVTGDTIPKPMREFGSVVVSGLMGGPVGLATSLGILAFEKLSGIDFEDVEQSILASFNPSQPAASAAASTASGVAAPATAPVAATAPTVATPLPNGAVAALPTVIAAASPAVSAPVQRGAWTPAQLAAYGVVKLPDGNLRHGELTGADVLNDLQLRSTAGTLAPA